MYVFQSSKEVAGLSYWGNIGGKGIKLRRIHYRFPCSQSILNDSCLFTISCFKFHSEVIALGLK